MPKKCTILRIFDNLNFSGETDLDTRFARFDFAILYGEIEKLKYLTDGCDSFLTKNIR